jgi:hypothetical protein
VMRNKVNVSWSDHAEKPFVGRLGNRVTECLYIFQVSRGMFTRLTAGRCSMDF